MKGIEADQDAIKGIVDYYNRQFHGKIVKITKGKYKDRLAKIDGCIPCHKHGLLFGCMVLRKDGKTILNSDGESRQYRPINEFTEC